MAEGREVRPAAGAAYAALAPERSAGFYGYAPTARELAAALAATDAGCNRSRGRSDQLANQRAKADRAARRAAAELRVLELDAERASASARAEYLATQEEGRTAEEVCDRRGADEGVPGPAQSTAAPIAVSGRRRGCNVAVPPGLRDQVMMAMNDAGITMTKIAEVFDVSPGRVAQILKRCRKWEVWTPEQQAAEFSEVRGEE